jgi:hypothetical protein
MATSNKPAPTTPAAGAAAATPPRDAVDDFFYQVYDPKRITLLRDYIDVHYKKRMDPATGNLVPLPSAVSPYLETAKQSFDALSKTALAKAQDAVESKYLDELPSSENPTTLANRKEADLGRARRDALYKLARSTLRMYANAMAREKRKLYRRVHYLHAWDAKGMVPAAERDALLKDLTSLDASFKALYEYVVSPKSAEGKGGGFTVEQMEELTALMDQMESKIVLAEDKAMSLTDLLSDRQFQWMYILKFARYFFIWLALYLAEKVFYEWYERRVYIEHAEPPSLVAFLGIFLAIDLAFNVVVFLLLYLIRHLFEDDTNFFVIDNTFLRLYVTDYLLSMGLIFALTAMIAITIQKKKYFNYKLSGGRAVKALKEMMLMLVLVLLMVPYFLVVS